MKNTLTIWFALLTMLILTAFTSDVCADVGSGRHILFLSDYHEGCVWAEQIVQGLQEVLTDDSGEKVELYIENLLGYLIDDSEYVQYSTELLNAKYRDFDLDLAVVLGGPSMAYVRDHLADNLLKDVALIYCSTDSSQPVMFARPEDYVPASTIVPIQETIRLAKTFQPEIRQLLLIADKSAVEMFPQLQSPQAIIDCGNKLGIEVVFVSDDKYSTEQMLNLVASQQSPGAVLLVRWQHGLDVPLNTEAKIYESILSLSQVPVYIVCSDLVGKGFIGGNVVQLRQIGRKAGLMARNYLAGDMDFSGITEERLSRNVFDLNALLRWNISVSAIPVGADIYEAGGEKLASGEITHELNASELQWLGEGQKASVAVLVRPPLVMLDGNEPTGYAIDYLKLLAEKSQIELEYIFNHKSIAQYLAEVKAGKGPDVIIGMESTPQRSEYIDFTRPWLSMYFTLFVGSQDDMIFYNGLESLAGRTIAVENGSHAHEMLVERYGFIDLLPVDNAIDGLKAVSRGEVFGWLGDHNVGLFVARSENIDNIKVGANVPELGRHDISLGVRKGNPLLFSVLNKTMASIPQQKLDQLRQKYNSEFRYEPGLSFEAAVELIALVLLVFAVVLFLIGMRIRKVAREVRDSKENLRLAFDSIADAVIVTDLEGKVTRINPVAAQLTGWNTQQALGQAVSEVFDIVDPATMKEIAGPLTVVKDGQGETGELMAALISHNGRRYYISYSASGVKQNNSEICGMVLIFRDITESFEMEQRMRRAEKERELILDNITVGVCFYDQNYARVRYNRQMESYFNQQIGSDIENIICSGSWQANDQSATGNKFNVSKPKDQSQPGYELEVTVVPVNEDERFVGVLVVVVDITEYRRLQTELEEAYARLRRYSGDLEDEVRRQTSVLEDRNIELGNALEELRQAQGKLVLSEKMAALGQLISGIAHEINAPLGVIIASAEIISRSLEHLVTNIELVDRILMGENAEQVNRLLSNGIVFRRSNVTMATRDERELRNRIAGQLREAGIADTNDYIASFLANAGVADSWSDYIDLLRQDNCMDVLYELANILNICTSCATVLSSVEKASSIVMALKSYVHRNNYTSGYEEKQVFDLVPGLKNVFVLFGSKFRQRVKLLLDIQSVPGVRGVPDELNQVWTNIIQNALQAMPDGGELSVSVRPDGGGVVVSFSDTGCGMEKEVLDRVFDWQFTTRSDGRSTGMGMDIVRRIVEESFNGKISLQSQPGKGTTVNIWLPAIQSQ